MQYDIKRGRNSIKEYTRVRYKGAQLSLSLSPHFPEQLTRLASFVCERFIETSLGDRVVCLRRNCSNSISKPPSSLRYCLRPSSRLNSPGPDSVLGYTCSEACARALSLSLCLSLGLSADRTPFLSDFVCLLRGMPGIRWMVF